MSTRLTLLTGGAIADARGVFEGPSGVLLEGESVLGAGPLRDVVRHEAAPQAMREDRPRSVLLPAMVNAHTHLDLSHIGPREYDPAAGFVGWGGMIREARHSDEAGIRRAVELGIELSRAGGVAALGDVAGIESLVPASTMAQHAMLGVSFLEVFGSGSRGQSAAQRVRSLVSSWESRAPGVRVGVQPHAPYSAGLGLYNAANEFGVPLSTHLSEMPEEIALVSGAGGAMRAFLEDLGAWTTEYEAQVGQGRTPTEHLAAVLEKQPWLVAHVNSCTDRDLEILAETGAAVAYCPRSSAYFQRERDFGPHRYAEMLQIGVNVALGTDSIVNVPHSESDRLSVLDEARLLFRRDAAAPQTLVQMMTANGARALGLDEHLFMFTEGPIAGVVGVEVESEREPVRGLFDEDGQVEWLVMGQA